MAFSLTDLFSGVPVTPSASTSVDFTPTLGKNILGISSAIAANQTKNPLQGFGFNTPTVSPTSNNAASSILGVKTSPTASSVQGPTNPTAVPPAALTAKNQILNTAALSQYSPTQYTKDVSGAIYLNAGVTPIAGTTKQVGGATVPVTPIAAPVVKTPSTITAAGVTNSPQTMPDIPQSENPPTQTADQLVAASKTALQKAQDSYNQANTMSTTDSGTGIINTNITDTQAKINALQSEIGGKGAAQTLLQNDLGVLDNTKRLQDLNAEIAQKTAAYDQGLLDVNGKPIPMQFITGQQAQMNLQKATDIGALTSLTQAIQGNISLAQQTAKQTIDTKFAPLETQLQQYQSQLAGLQDKLTGAEKKKADEMSYLLTQQQNSVTEQKANQNTIMNTYLQAGAGKAPADVLDKIKNASSVFEANMLAMPYLKTSGDWVLFTDPNTGEQMQQDKNTGAIKPAEAPGTTQTYFTDANGINWNVAGWATDTTKQAQMQSIANQIGKVTDANLTDKVKQFAPGLTPDMIKSTSAKTGVSWEALLTTVNQEAQGGQSNVAVNNNNFGGLTYSPNSQWLNPQYGGVKGTNRPAEEGGNYIAFPNKQAGLDAMGTLMAQYGTVIPSSQAGTSDAVKYWAQQIQSGKYKLSDVYPPALAGAVVKQMATTPSQTDTTLQDSLKSKVTIADNILSDKGVLGTGIGSGMAGAVGPNVLARISPSSILTGAKQNFIANVQQLVSSESLKSLIDAKAQGATFGALSDKELNLLASAATKIGSWEVRDKTGKVVGYNASQGDFTKEISKLKDSYSKLLEGNIAPNIQTLPDGTKWQANADGTYTQV